MTKPPAAHDTSQDETQQSPHPHPQQPLAPRPLHERRVLVGVTIALASLLFLATSGLLYLRWATMREPMCIFIVEAPSSLRGAEVTVDGLGVPKPHTVTIGRGERFAMPFYLDYGTYSVRVTLNGASVLDTEVVLTREAPWQKIDLSQFPLPKAPAPATTRSAPVWVPGEAP